MGLKDWLDRREAKKLADEEKTLGFFKELSNVLDTLNTLDTPITARARVLTFSKGVVSYRPKTVATSLAALKIESDKDSSLEKKIREIFEANPHVNYKALEPILGVEFLDVQIRGDGRSGIYVEE